MLRRVVRWQLSGLVLALAAGALALSCGGGAERQTVSGPAPVAAVQPPTASDDGGSVGEASQPKVTVCHYGKDLSIAAPAVQAHLNHGDKLGSCTPAATCPCFTSQGLLTCPTELILGSTCYGEFSLEVSCTPPRSAPPGTEPGGVLDGRVVLDPPTTCIAYGSGSYVEKPLTTADQVAACRQFILTSPYYPTCKKAY